MATRRKPISEQARKKLELQSQALILGLFYPNQRPFFEERDYSNDELESFIKSNDVYKETLRFVIALKEIWKTQNPDSPPLVPLPVLPPKIHDVNAQTVTLPIQESAMNVEETIPPELLAPTEQMITPEPEPITAPIPIQPGQTPPANTPPRLPSAPVPNVRFMLPNAKVGVAYRARLEGQTAEGTVQIMELRLPDDLGLHFDTEHVELHGIPTLAGEHPLRVLWTLDRRERYSSECVLIVNPDPKTLWQVKEPAADAPYPKAHTEQQALTGFGFRIAAASRRGRSHEHNGTFRDDDFVINL
ncbi:MAG: protein phosphatase 2C domain-containing protein, partial [Chromatium okenii]|nr:protein phosphatase 2C domain-containing protein [Chromatium okenii]